MPRKKANIHYIYKTTCKVTDRYYIGMHSTSNENDGYMGSGKRLRYSIRKHGKENHEREILEYFDTREQLIEREKELITLDIITDNNCMNIMSGGTGGFISIEQQKFRSICGGKANAMKLKNDLEYQKRQRGWTSKNGTKMYELGHFKRADWTGKKHIPETKELMSKRAKERVGIKNSQFGTCWITKDGENKKIKKDDLNQYEKIGWVKGRK